MMKNKTLLYAIAAICGLGILGTWLFLYGAGIFQQDVTLPDDSRSSITNFKECGVAGYPIMESYPRQCRTPDGRRFIEEISQGIEKAPVPHRIEPYSLDSGIHNNQGNDFVVASDDVIQFSGAPWLGIVFGNSSLGEQSFVQLTSLKEGAKQKLTSQSMTEWQNASAFFNGDAVEVELHVAPREGGIFFEVKEVMVGEWMSNFPATPASPDAEE